MHVVTVLIGKLNVCIVRSLSKMSFLRGSLNYVWCTTSVLGKGATGAVFQVKKKKKLFPSKEQTNNGTFVIIVNVKFHFLSERFIQQFKSSKLFYRSTGSKQTQWRTCCSENIQSNESYETR